MINQVYEIVMSNIDGLEPGEHRHWMALVKDASALSKETLADWYSFKIVDSKGDTLLLANGLHKPFELDIEVPIVEKTSQNKGLISDLKPREWDDSIRVASTPLAGKSVFKTAFNGR